MKTNSSRNIANLVLSRLLRFVISLVLVALFIGIAAVREARPATFTVVNTNSSGAGSFHQAIQDTRNNPGADTIVFSIPGPGPHTILNDGNGLRLDESTVLIDGWSQGGAGYTGPPLIVLSIQPGFGGLWIRSDNNTVRGLVINTGQQGEPLIDITGSNNLVQGCYIGTSADGNFPVSNLTVGIKISGDNNLIGGSTTGARNVISGNGHIGIHIRETIGFGIGDNNRIEGNYIGTNASGNFALANGSTGVQISAGSGNIVGGTTPGQRNIISANFGPGVFMDAAATDNRVEGNYIGLNAAGTGGLGNRSGVTVWGNANTIGGPGPERRNVICNSAGVVEGSHGVTIKGSNNNVQGNYIGIDPTGTVAIGNANYGILIDEGDNNLIGGVGPQFGNLVAANGGIGGPPGGGIRLDNGADNNVIINNAINANAGGGNEGGNGIWIRNGSNNRIGGTATLGDITFSVGNTIAANYARGVFISGTVGSPNSGNKISRNSIFDNGITLYPGQGLMGIDLDPFNLTPNDACDTDSGPNFLQNYPVLASAVSADNVLTVSGSFNSEPGEIYTIEFFSNTSCSVSGNGQGRTFLGETQVSIPNGPSCSISFQRTLNTPTLPAGTIITATATDSDGNTSEFSLCRAVVGSSLQFSLGSYMVAENGGSATITVTRTGASGGAASVNYSTTSGGTASPGADYTPTSGTLNFAANETSKTFSIPILDDNFYEGDETVNIFLSNPSSGTILGSPDTAVLTIADNEPLPAIGITDVSQTEGNGGATNFTFTVSLANASAQTVSVNYATADGTATTANNDYQSAGTTLTFTPMQTSRTFNVVVNGDMAGEPNETFFVNLSNPTNATISDHQGQGTILNDDPCNNSINPTSINSSSGGGMGVVNVTSPCSWTAVSNAAWITVTGGASGTGNGMVNYSVAANSGAFRTGTITIAGQTFTVNQAAGGPRTLYDFDGDGRTDFAIFRPSNGVWWYMKSSTGNVETPLFIFGTGNDIIAPADMSGDGKTDLVFFRPETGQWFIQRSEDNTFSAFAFGANGDVPATGDFDNDGKADAAVFRPSIGTWFILQSSDSQVRIEQFGQQGDQPVTGDYDGDGRADIAVWRESQGLWYVNRSTAGPLVVLFGQAGDEAIPADYTGDGKTDIAFWRPSTGFWLILKSEDFTAYGFTFGTTGDQPTPGDYDGDGKADAAVFRPSIGTWFAQQSSPPNGTTIIQWGTAGDKAIPNAFVR